MKSRLAPKFAAVASSLFLGSAYVSCNQNGGSLLPSSKSRSIGLDAAGGVTTTQETAAAPTPATQPALLYSSKSKSPIFTPEALPLATFEVPRASRALLPGSKSAAVIIPRESPDQRGRAATLRILPGSKSAAVFSEEDVKPLISPATQPVIPTAEPAGPPVPVR